ncbi:hypothetical protein [Streptomyces abyssomicinicus]|uniref:hypothetical protein n=1 Tax=Streptomyces abyssomicinicus TaxID=574929 RepID=UPI00124FB5AC|nr:hypothetical protein [Streptomyces abyssomicinicus]
MLTVAGFAVPALTATPAYAASCNTNQAIAAATVAGNFSTVDTAYDGTQDGLISRTDLDIVVQGFRYSNNLRFSAALILGDDNFFRQIDTARQGGQPDGLLSLDDLNAACTVAPCNTSQAIAAETIAGNFSTVDMAYDGTQDGLISRTDLDIVAGGSDYPNYLRDSSRVLLDGDFFREIDTAGQGGQPDGLLSVGDLNAACG